MLLDIMPALCYTRDCHYLSDGLETRTLPYSKVHISVLAIINTGKKMRAVRSFTGSLGNGDDGRPDNGVGIFFGIHTSPQWWYSVLKASLRRACFLSALCQ